MTKLKVEVLRAFCLAGERIEAGRAIEIGATLAAELLARGVVAQHHAAAADEAAAKPARKRRAEGQEQ